MIRETMTALGGEEVLRRARDFFATRVPATGAFVERESASHLVLRGQGGEEIVIAVAQRPDGPGSRVRGSTLLFGQQLERFYSTLPPAAPAGAGATGGSAVAPAAPFGSGPSPSAPDGGAAR